MAPKKDDAKTTGCPNCGRPAAEAVERQQSRKDTPRHPADDVATVCPCGYVWSVETRELAE